MSSGLCSPAGPRLISLDSVNALKRDADLLRSRIGELALEIESHEQRIALLKAEKDELFDAVRRIEYLTAEGGGDGGLRSEDNSNGTPRFADGALRTDTELPPAEQNSARSGTATVAELIEGVIRSAGTPLHYKEILSRLQSEGADIGGKDPAATLLSILANKRYEARFARSDRGVYTLFTAGSQAQKPSKRRRRRAKTVRSGGDK